MELKLTADKEQLVLDNQYLVYFLVKKLGIHPSFPDYEDIISCGTLGLVKAAITFSETKNFSFKTYAATCINNEIFMYWRKSKKYLNNLYLDGPIGQDDDGNSFTLQDILPNSDSDFFENADNREYLSQIINIIINCLEKKSRLVILYRLAGKRQEDIAKIINLCQTSVSKKIAKALIKVRKLANNPRPYKKVFTLSITENEYILSFCKKDVNTSFLENIFDISRKTEFSLRNNKKNVEIHLLACPESFDFIAQLIQGFDNSCSSSEK